MTGLNVETRAQYAAGMESDFNTAQADNIIARQARLAEAMRGLFFRQLKLINAVMIELPLGWMSADAEPAKVSYGPPSATQSMMSDDSAPSFGPTEPIVDPDPPGAAVAPMPQREASPFAAAKARRKGKMTPKNTVS